MCPLTQLISTVSQAKRTSGPEQQNIKQKIASSFHLKTQEETVKYLDVGLGAFSPTTKPGPLVEQAFYLKEEKISQLALFVQMQDVKNDRCVVLEKDLEHCFEEKIYSNCDFLYGTIYAYYKKERKDALMEKLSFCLMHHFFKSIALTELFISRFKFCEEMEIIKFSSASITLFLQISYEKFKTLYDEKGNVELVDKEKRTQKFYTPKVSLEASTPTFTVLLMERILQLIQEEIASCENCFIHLSLSLVFVPIETYAKALARKGLAKEISKLDNEKSPLHFSTVLPCFPLNANSLVVHYLEDRCFLQEDLPQEVTKELKRFLTREPFFQKTDQIVEAGFPWRLYLEESFDTYNVNFVLSHSFYLIKTFFLNLRITKFFPEFEENDKFFVKMFCKTASDILEFSKKTDLQSNILTNNPFNKESRKTLMLDLGFFTVQVQKLTSSLKEEKYLKHSKPKKRQQTMAVLEPSRQQRENARALNAKTRLQKKLLERKKASEEEQKPKQKLEEQGAYAIDVNGKGKHVVEALSYQEKQETLKDKVSVYYPTEQTFSDVDFVSNLIMKRKKLILLDLNNFEDSEVSFAIANMCELFLLEAKTCLQENFNQEDATNGVYLDLTTNLLLCDKGSVISALQRFYDSLSPQDETKNTITEVIVATMERGEDGKLKVGMKKEVAFQTH